MIRILLVDDHAVVRTGIKLMLKNAKDIEVVAEASNGEDAIQLAREVRPDVVLMDINMPGIGGLEATLRILRGDQSMKVLIISSHNDDILPTRLMHLGASGYLNKSANQDALIEAIKTVHAGKYFMDPSMISNSMILRPSPAPGAEHTYFPFKDLTERELQILLMVARGIEVSEIAQKLYVSQKTINTYRNSIFKKLGVKTDVEATRLAATYGLIDVDTQWH